MVRRRQGRVGVKLLSRATVGGIECPHVCLEIPCYRREHVAELARQNGPTRQSLATGRWLFHIRRSPRSVRYSNGDGERTVVVRKYRRGPRTNMLSTKGQVCA